LVIDDLDVVEAESQRLAARMSDDENLAAQPGLHEVPRAQGLVVGADRERHRLRYRLGQGREREVDIGSLRMVQDLLDRERTLDVFPAPIREAGLRMIKRDT